MIRQKAEPFLLVHQPGGVGACLLSQPGLLGTERPGGPASPSGKMCLLPLPPFLWPLGSVKVDPKARLEDNLLPEDRHTQVQYICCPSSKGLRMKGS